MDKRRGFLAATLLLVAAAGSTARPPDAQPLSTPGIVSPIAAPQQLRVRFHRMRLSTLRSHTGDERGWWLRGSLLSDDYARRAALVQFLRTELIPYLAAERTIFYPVADAVLGSAHELTLAAISDGLVIARFIERLEAAARSADALAFQDNAEALSIVLDNYFARDRWLIQQVLALGARMGPRRAVIADRGAFAGTGSPRVLSSGGSEGT